MLRSSADLKFMRAALSEARRAESKGEVPVGAVIAHEGKLIARAHNLTESKQDPCAHAELLVLRKAAKKLGRWRLSGCSLYATLEPCSMCAGAAVLARVDRVAYAAKDPKAGACGSVLQVLPHEKLNHRPALDAGLFEEESSQMLKEFFRARRKKA